ncbi:MAG: hypothetical protein WDZ68_01955 [Candidatus Paceibacterota bacterium]
MNIQSVSNKFATKFAPILGAGAVGVCPLCWLGSASLLTYLGLGALIPVWQGFVFVLIGIGLIGFLLDFRSHKNIKPILLLIAGAILLYVGRYFFIGADFGYWPIWGTGALLIVVAVILNKREFKKEKTQHE